MSARPRRCGRAAWPPNSTASVSDGRIPAAVLAENRRQHHPAERVALAAYRDGDVDASQAIRTAAGLEHEHPTPQATRDAMADAVAADVVAHGAASVVALAVSHVDCEDLADRVGSASAPPGDSADRSLEGPGWGGEARRYQAGDRVLLHSQRRNRRRPSAQRDRARPSPR